MRTFLLIWNPNDYEQLYQDHEEWTRGGFESVDWSCGNRKDIHTGERVFVVRTTIEPKGVIASGYAVSEWERSNDGPNQNFNWFSFDTFSHPDHPLVSLDELLAIRNQTYGLWTSAASGVIVDEDTAEKLEAVWEDASRRDRLVRRDVFSDPTVPGAPEGRLRFVAHLIRERRPSLVAQKKAEAKRKHGKLACEGCDVVLADVYGPVAENFIEFHHVKWLSWSGETITTLDDLALLCPNCHSIVHLAKHETVAALRQERSEKRLWR